MLTDKAAAAPTAPAEVGLESGKVAQSHGGFCLVVTMAMACVLSGASRARDSSPESKPSVQSNGLVHAPSFDLPLSRYMSEEAKRAFRAAFTKPPEQLDWSKATIEQIRKMDDDALIPYLERLKALYPVTISDRTIGTVHTRVVTPRLGIPQNDKYRVLLNLHGGGFFEGANAQALVESIPIAATARMKVITIDYRQGPEYRFPAATDDVIAVYRELLKKKEFSAASIGIYGCSAGGILTAEVAAALGRRNMPRPAAIGIFSSGAYANWSGDPLKRGSWGGISRYWAGPVNGQSGLQPTEQMSPFFTAYLRDVDPGDPRVSPAESPAVLAKFPPTLLLTGTRAFDLSAVVETHRQLIKNGAQAELHLWDGLNHCFFLDPELPESKEAYQVIAAFFARHLH